jgi:hypothetical protein
MLPVQKYLSTLSTEELAVAKSHLFNIFRANPWLSKLYLSCFEIIDTNSRLTNNLPDQSGNFCNPNPKGPRGMSLNKNVRVCTHIKVNGVPCGSPALRGEVFCYFHQRMVRGVRTPEKSRLHPIALIESEEAIQASLMEIINALVRNTIDLRRAQLMLRALHIAVKNSPRVHFQLYQREMVRGIPDYPAAPARQESPAPTLAQAGALATIKRRKLAAIDPARPKPPARAIPLRAEPARSG